ncbi:MAG: type II secretion system protein J [Wujia sp.]
MKKVTKGNEGFSLIELIIAIAVLAFLMTAVGAFMSTTVRQNKKVKVDVKMQTQAQDTYDLITDAFMQAGDILVAGYKTDDNSALDFSKTGESFTSTTVNEVYYVKDEAAMDRVIASPASYGIRSGVSLSKGAGGNLKTFTEINPDDPFYPTYIRIETSVPLDMNYVPGGNPASMATQTIANTLTGAGVAVSCKLESGMTKKAYSVNDTLVHSFYFEDGVMYYGRKYAYMTDLDDFCNIENDTSKKLHVYNKNFCKIDVSGTSVTGCVASIDAENATVGIDLFYNKSNMDYTTLGRVNVRNSYVLKPRK